MLGPERQRLADCGVILEVTEMTTVIKQAAGVGKPGKPRFSGLGAPRAPPNRN